jgi:hypothetical protein
MPEYPYVAEIEVPRLRLDVKNPRIANQPDRQRDAYGRLAEVQSDRFLALSKDVVNHGLGPQPFIVIPGDESGDPETDPFIVLDGNRRLTVLKALESPDIVEGHITESEMRVLKALKDGYRPIGEVLCVVFENRDAANRWIDMLHGSDMPAGLLPWTSQQKARFRARGGTQPYHLQVLDFVREDGQISPEARQRIDDGTYPVSTLLRLLVTPEVRDRLGVDFSDNEVLLHYPKLEVLKGLSKVVDEIGTGVLKVNRLMRHDDRMSYVGTLKSAELPDQASRLSTPVPLEEAASQSDRAATRARPKRGSNKLIPPEVDLTIGAPRVRQIYNEMKSKLNLDQMPNATGVLLRVFFEFSLEEYIARNTLTVKTSRPEATLVEKGNTVIAHMETERILTKKELLAAREAINPSSTVAVMHAVLHQRDFQVSPNDLRVTWGRLQRFFERLWPTP